MDAKTDTRQDAKTILIAEDDDWLRRILVELLRHVRASERTASLPVIVVSGALDSDAQARLHRRAQRADTVLEKPVDVGRLFEEVEHAVWPLPSLAPDGVAPAPR